LVSKHRASREKKLFAGENREEAIFLPTKGRGGNKKRNLDRRPEPGIFWGAGNLNGKKAGGWEKRKGKFKKTCDGGGGKKIL